VLKNRFLLIDPKRFNASMKNLSKEIDLDDKADLSLLKRAVKEEWQSWRNGKSTFDASDDGKMDVLRFATLVSRFYDSNELKEIQKKDSFPITDLEKMVAFPNRWEIRWSSEDEADFEIQDVLFTFMKEVKCSIYSKNLEKTGSVIIDCPGLFASRRDTERAIEAMMKADAIWYLLKGDKELDMGSLKQLQEIKTNGMLDKLFLTLNMKIAKKALKERILPADVAKLKNEDFPVTEENVYLYHAFLALASENGEPILNDSLDDHSKNEFLKIADEMDYECDDIKATWREMVIDSLRDLRVDSRNSIIDLDEDAIKIAREESHFDIILNNIESFMLEKKAFSILVKNGSEKTLSVLKDLEADLKQNEDNAQLSVDESEEIFNQAEKKIDRFIKRSKIFINQILPENIVDDIAKDCYENVIVPTVRNEQFKDEIIKRFDDKEGLESGALDFVFTGKAELAERINGFMVDVLGDRSKQAFNVWQSQIKLGNNQVYENKFRLAVNEVIRELEVDWSDLDISKLPGFKGKNLPDLEIDTDIEMYFNMDLDFENTFDFPNILKRLWDVITDLFISGLKQMIWEIAVLAEMKSNIDRSKSNHIINLIDQMHEYLGQELEKIEVREKFVTQLKEEKLNSYRENIIRDFDKAFKKYKSKLAYQKKKAKKSYQEEQAKRDEVAEEANSLRTTQIEPARIKIQTYDENIKTLLKQSE